MRLGLIVLNKGRGWMDLRVFAMTQQKISLFTGTLAIPRDNEYHLKLQHYHSTSLLLRIYLGQPPQPDFRFASHIQTSTNQQDSPSAIVDRPPTIHIYQPTPVLSTDKAKWLSPGLSTMSGPCFCWSRRFSFSSLLSLHQWWMISRSLRSLSPTHPPNAILL